jgi:hypothetical protein
MRMIGVSLQTAAFVVTLSCIPVIVLLYFTEEILIGLKQDPYVSSLAGILVRYYDINMMNNYDINIVNGGRCWHIS